MHNPQGTYNFTTHSNDLLTHTNSVLLVPVPGYITTSLLHYNNLLTHACYLCSPSCTVQLHYSLQQSTDEYMQCGTHSRPVNPCLVPDMHGDHATPHTGLVSSKINCWYVFTLQLAYHCSVLVTHSSSFSSLISFTCHKSTVLVGNVLASHYLCFPLSPLALL